jgi:hypothetical protein
VKTGGVIITGIPTIGRAIERRGGGGEERGKRREGRREERTEREEKGVRKSIGY